MEGLWELSVSSSLDRFNLGLKPQRKYLKVDDLGDGEEIQMAEQRQDQSSMMHFSHFNMQTDVI